MLLRRCVVLDERFVRAIKEKRRFVRALCALVRVSLS